MSYPAPYFNPSHEDALTTLFFWEEENEEHVWEWTLLRSNVTGIVYEIESMYCPCCGGPKGVATPVWAASFWTPPEWATPAQTAIFAPQVLRAFTEPNPS